MTSFGLDEWFWAMFEPTWTWPNFTFGQLSCELGPIMTRYDFIWARWVILSNGSFEKNAQNGATNLIRFYITLKWGEKLFLPSKKQTYYIFKVVDFGDIALCSKESSSFTLGQLLCELGQITRRLCVLSNTKLYHRNLLLWRSAMFAI